MSTIRGDSGWERARTLFFTYYPLVGLLLTLLVAGLLLRQQGLATLDVLARYRLFFRLILASLVVAVLRNEVGFQTYGLFAPVAIAFVLLEAGPFWGMVLFLNIFIAALAVYFILAPFRLGTAHRVATLISVVAIVLALFQVLGDFDSLPQFFTSVSVFFPGIISAWYADKFARTVEERGWTVPSIQFIWTLLAIVTAYVVISREAFVNWFIVTPEAWTGAIALNLLLATGTNVRLKEYVRFGGLIADDPTTAALTRLRLAAHNLQVRLGRLVGKPGELKTFDHALSMNVRNRYIERYNPPNVRPGVTKISMKRRFNDLGIPTAQTFALLEETNDLRRLDAIFESFDEFVVKPEGSFGGEGIVVVTGRDDETGDFRTAGGSISKRELRAHVRRIVQGHYAGLTLDGAAIVEERLVPHELFRELCGRGVPDVRVIVFDGYPVMAMTRLPTAESDGAANLHKGAVGVGLRVSDGTPRGAYQQSHHRWLAQHPDTGADLTGFTIPNWDDVLETSVRAAAASGLRIAGVDVTVDSAGKTPVFEVNVRPGLGIQNTNRASLLRRFRFVEALPQRYLHKSRREKIALAKQWDADGYDTEVWE